ncbi:uncharacterized protein LOC112169513 [Rosa chinensis]|uniref:uncharacterized protein LOC112169513 n=1 Tax=Rosa chinensis TaxID=74649 RepID=UPI001AD8F55E|nr:uncharacterized protein LOC112169513 [Rosa chinensis]
MANGGIIQAPLDSLKICRGICNTTTLRALRDLIAQNQPQIVFLCETKIGQIGDFKALHRELGFAHYKEVLSDGQSGGLGFFWTEDITVQVLTFSSHHIDLEVSSGPGEPRWRLTGFYGYARTCECDLSWQLIRDLCDFDSLPWVIIGDFNEILNNEEKTGGPIRPERQMRGFREALSYSELIDLGFQGAKMTWWNSETQLRLDRAVATASWSDVFGFSRVKHLSPSDSDHTPILLQASSVPLPKRPRRHRFKFESFWLQHEECDPLVLEKWQTDFEGVPMFALTRKIMCTRRALESWQQQTFRFRQQQMIEVLGRLEFLMGEQLTVELHEEKKTLIASLQDLLSPEEVFWKQPAKVIWLQEALDSEAVDLTLAAIQPCVTAEMNKQLCEQYTEEEVRCALFQMYPTKSPGPDETMEDLRLIALCNVIYKLCSKCITSVRYSFLVRGKPRGFVIPSRGLRQSDPLSPYLFLFGAESFSALLQQKQRLGLLPGIAICQNPPRVNHLLFADDSMLYAQPTPEACFHIKEVIKVYGRASGQVVNFNKSSVAFSKNVGEPTQGSMAHLLGVVIVESHERYLGLPTYVGRKETATFEYIKERLGEKLKLWQGKLLSGDGKDILIRVVAQALPNYAMSVFQLTKKLCENLEQMCARFWWGSSSDKRKIHWKKWDDLCHAKEVGGLGFKSLSEFNMSMLAKQAWRVGIGHNVSVWNDAWIPKLPSHKPQVALVSQPDVQTVNELIIPPNNWDEHKVRSIFVPDEAAAILSIPLSNRQPEDRLTWHLEKKCMFTVKSAYHSAFSRKASTLPPSVVANQRVWKKIWNAKMPSSAKVTAWKICHNILPTMDRLDSRHVELESQVCVLCNVETETIIHICRNCTFTRDVLALMPA